MSETETTTTTTASRIAEIDRLIAELTAERRTISAADRLAPYSVSAKRRESLEIAVELGADDETLEKLAQATRLSRGDRLRINTRFGGLSRGKAWGRRGSGDQVEWAEKDGGTVYLTPGQWTVGSSDGFRRKETATDWHVEHVRVGDQVWTIGS